jgi:uncharacterized protein involved in outer membrane biogenesis
MAALRAARLLAGNALLASNPGENEEQSGGNMSRPLKIILISVAASLVLALLVPYLVDVDRYRPQMEAEVQKQTGRRLEIGKLRARVLPSLGFTLEKVALGPPPGFADVNLLTAEEIQGSIALLPLLRGELEVTSVDVEKPAVILATDEHGKTNYDFTPHAAGPKPGGYKSAAYAPDLPAPSAALALDSLSISDAAVSVVQVRGHKALPPSVKLSGLNGEFSNLDFSPQGMARWQGKVPLSGVKVAVAGAPPVTIRSGALTLAKGAAAGSGEAELAEAGRVKGDISIPSLEKLMATSSATRGEAVGSAKITSDKLRYAPYEITNVAADARIFPGRIEAPITAAGYGGAINVHARLDTEAAPSRLSLNIQVEHLDLEKVLAADPSTRGKMTGHGELKMQVAAALGASLEKSLTGEGNFALRDGKLPGVELGKSMRELSRVEEILSLGAVGHEIAGETTFRVIDGDLELQGERLHTNKTHLETNVGQGDLRGSVGFDQTLDLTGTWNLPKSSRAGAATAGMVGATVLTGGVLAPALFGASGAMLKVPFSIKGTVKDPKLTAGGGSSGADSGESQQDSAQQQPQKKKKLFGIFGKP